MFADVEHKIYRPETYVSRLQTLCFTAAKIFFEAAKIYYFFDSTKKSSRNS